MKGIVLGELQLQWLARYVGVSAGTWDMDDSDIYPSDYFFRNDALNSDLLVALFGKKHGY